MENLNKYIKGLNPKDNEKNILMYSSKYKLYRDNKYIGVATWTKDDNVGDSFQVIDNGIVMVYSADSWELIIK